MLFEVLAIRVHFDVRIRLSFTQGSVAERSKALV